MKIHSNHSGRLLLFAAIAIFGVMSLPANAQQRAIRGLAGTQSGVAAAHSQEARQQREEYDAPNQQAAVRGRPGTQSGVAAAHSQEARQQREDKVTAIQAHRVD
jgi:hypothetical protein